MTTLDELCEAIAAINLPWTNTAWGRGDDVTAPYIVLVKSGGDTYGADNATWYAVAEYDVELYCSNRDYGLERAVRTALDDAGIYWSDGGTWSIPTESLIETVYTVTVREN